MRVVKIREALAGRPIRPGISYPYERPIHHEVDCLIHRNGPAFHDTFGTLDIGGGFQFISRVGVDWRIEEDWRVGYRYEHTSNAGLNEPNPGLNFHVLGVAWMF